MNFQLLTFIGGIAILIILHEFGHFLAAKLLKVDVEEFGIGFPPRLFKLFSSGGTEFTLNWIPLGGFVRIKGENDPDVPGGLAAANPWVRFAVISAGPITNILIGIILSVLVFYQAGEPIPNRVKVLGIAPGSPAAQAGLQTGDIILEVQNNKVDSVDKLHDLIYQRLGVPTTLVYERNGRNFSTTLTPRNPPPPDQGAIGILMGVDTRPTTVIKAIPRGVQASFNYVAMLFSLPKMLLTKQISPEMARPVGYKGMYDIYQQVQDPFSFFTMITMSLGVLNLFPIPALDGGRLLFTSFEIITRRRLPPKYENAIHMVGFVLLLALLVYINIMDFVSPVKLPF